MWMYYGITDRTGLIEGIVIIGFPFKNMTSYLNYDEDFDRRITHKKCTELVLYSDVVK